MEYSFQTSCSKNKLAEIRSFVQGSLANHSLSDIEVNSMVLAVEEIVANLIIHSHKCNDRDKIKLNIEVDKNNLITFKITDQGHGFNICEYKEPSLQEIIRQKKKGGLGLMLVRRIMDHIEYINGNTQNIYTLIKKCNPS
jgi:serine/threonine-protein kinase RsbW